MKTSFGWLKLYLIVATLAWLFGVLGWYGMLVYNVLGHTIISDDEYFAGNNYGYVDQCKQIWSEPKQKTIERTPVDQEKCITESKTNTINQRSLQYKQNIIEGGVWGTIFLILFLFHYPRFKKMTEE